MAEAAVAVVGAGEDWAEAVAGLELARDGAVELEQDAPFGPIWVKVGAGRTADLGAAA